MARELTPKQKRFVEEYLIDLNATQAAIRAGYSEKTAMEQGYQLLQNTSVQQAMQEASNKKTEELDITTEFVLNGIKSIATQGEQENNRLKAYELLGKYKKLFTDKVEHSGEFGVKIINDIPRNRD